MALSKYYFLHVTKYWSVLEGNAAAILYIMGTMKELPLLPLTDPDIGWSQQVTPIVSGFFFYILSSSPLLLGLIFSLRPLCPEIATCSSQKYTRFCTVAPSLFPSFYSCLSRFVSV